MSYYIYIYIKSCILDSNTDSNLRQIVFVNIDTYVYNIKMRANSKLNLGRFFNL